MKSSAHVWFNYRRLTWPVCKRCGLVLLKNEATARAARKACDGAED